MNPFQAYLIGLAQTDGHLSSQSRNRGKFTLELQYRDIDILHKIAENLECNYTIGERTRTTNFSKDYRSAYIRVCDRRFRSFLEENGVPVGRKSNIIKPPIDLDQNLHVDYLRGLIDGDGSVGITSVNKPFLGFVTGSEVMKDFFVWWMEKNTERKFTKLSRTSRDNIYQPVLYNEDAQSAIIKIYYSNCMALKRKLEKAKEVIQWERPLDIKKVNFQRKRWEPWEDGILMDCSNQEAVANLGRSLKSVTIRRWRLNNA